VKSGGNMLNKKLQGALEYIMILSAVIIVVIIAVVGYMYSAHNVKVGSFDEIISAQASSSNTLLLELSELLPPGAQIKGINFTGVPSGTSISVSLENQTPVYNDGYPEYSFSVSDLLLTPLTYYNVSDLVYEVNGKTIAVATSTGEPMAIEGTNGYNGGSSTLPSGIIAYVPITISNNQNVATPSPFQQMIQINEGNYANYIAYNGNIANFEFFTQSGSVLPAWIESNNSGTLTVWVRLPNGIPANSNSVIYLGFASKTTNLLSSSGTSDIGEAPQLSSTYAEYDDGASVFNNYWNFAGTSLPNGWKSSGSVSINNGVTIANAGSILQSSYTINPQTTITDAYWYDTGWGPTYFNPNFVLENDTTAWGFSVAGGCHVNYDSNGASSLGAVTGSYSDSSYWIGSIWTSTSGSYAMASYSSPNYLSWGFIPSTATAISFSPTEIYVIYVQWVRVRALPPNSVMPSVSFGSVQ